MSFDVKKITDKSKFAPCFCAFDLLYFNGKSLVGTPDEGGLPLTERLSLLDKVFEDVEGVIYHSKRSPVTERLDVVHALNRAIETGEEGIIIKETDSLYLANRRNGGWYKAKPDYTDGIMVDLDLVIIGGDYAENKSRGLVNSFLVALAEDPGPGRKPNRWLSIGRVSTGLSYTDREELCAKLSPHFKTMKHSPPSEIMFGKKKPDLWIHPDNSCVLQVRASELIRSAEFASEYTLRFPRVEAVRDDKPVEDILNIQQLNDITKSRSLVVKLSTGQINPAEVVAEPKKSRKRQINPPQIAAQFCASLFDSVEATSKALLGRKVLVLSEDEDCSKLELERIIQSHSGIPVQNITSDTWCCVAGKRNIRVTNAIKALKADIAKTNWLRQLPPSGEPCGLPSPLEAIALTPATKLKLARYYDEYGDNYTQESNVDSLKACFEEMDNNDHPKIYLTHEETLELETELFPNGNPYSYMRSCFIHALDPKHRLVLKAQLFGATLCDLESPNVTHVVVNKEIEKCIVDVMKSEKPNVFYVSDKWLESCFDVRQKVTESSFFVL